MIRWLVENWGAGVFIALFMLLMACAAFVGLLIEGVQLAVGQLRKRRTTRE